MLSSFAGLAQALSAVLVTASLSAPIEWSRDGEWIAHIAVESSDAPALPRDWLLSPDVPPTAAPPTADRDPSRTFRIWTTRVKDSRSVLIEESRRPLSSPSWGADGRSLVFARFVPSESEGPSARHGRFELVIQSGLDQRRVIVVQPDLELNPEAVETLCAQRAAVSPDGRQVAVLRPGPTGGAWVVRIDENRVVRTIEGATAASWSPDGRRLAFLRSVAGPDGQPVVSVHLMNPGGTNDRLVGTDPALTAAAPVWGLDGQSLLMISSPTRGPFRHAQVDLVRMSLDTGVNMRISTIEAASPRNGPRRFRTPGSIEPGDHPPVLRVDLALDDEQEQAVCLVESDGREQVLKWYQVRTQNVFKRLHPMDPGLRLGSPSLSPDGRVVAFRVDDGVVGGLAALCDLDTEEITLVAPDSGTRLRWLDRLAACSSLLIQTWLPTPGVRATSLPILGELGGLHPRQFRLQRLAKFARGLLDEPAPDGAADRLDEFRLFFAYLNRDYATAEQLLDVVEARADDPDARLRWLCLRAQVLLGQDQPERARGIIEYLAHATGSRVYSYEETPAGPILTDVLNPRSRWAEHLQEKATDGTLQRAKNAANDFGFDEEQELNLDEEDGGGRMPNVPFAPPGGFGDGNDPMFRPRGLGQPIDPGAPQPPPPAGIIPIAPQPGPGVPGAGFGPRPPLFEQILELNPALELEVEGEE